MLSAIGIRLGIAGGAAALAIAAMTGAIAPRSAHAQGSDWTVVPSPDTSSSADNYLDPSTCVDADDCWAVSDADVDRSDDISQCVRRVATPQAVGATEIGYTSASATT